MERLTLHYSGVSQVQFGHSVATTAAKNALTVQPIKTAGRKKCGDCGAYGHLAGECERFWCDICEKSGHHTDDCPVEAAAMRRTEKARSSAPSCS